MCLNIFLDENLYGHVQNGSRGFSGRKCINGTGRPLFTQLFVVQPPFEINLKNTSFQL